MAEVTLREGEHVDKALKRLRRKVEAAGVLRDVRSREFYLKPSEKRKEKIRAAARRRCRSAARVKRVVQ